MNKINAIWMAATLTLSACTPKNPECNKHCEGIAHYIAGNIGICLGSDVNHCKTATVEKFMRCVTNDIPEDDCAREAGVKLKKCLGSDE
ncbi:hypothetical protein HZA39_01110 [Candidatus Peregrinibacteria bacterium]|nr:hypothetical protein [Candidatus Peregrinibacteria bacterium]